MRRALRLAAARGLVATVAIGAAVGHAGAAAPAAETIAALSQSLAAEESRLGAAHPDLIPIIDGLAQWRYRTADFDAACALRRRSLAIARAAFGGGSAAAAEAEIALASTYIEMQRYLDAEPLLIAARIDLTARPAAADAASARLLTGLARIALARGDFREAEELARHAAAIEQGRRVPAAAERSAGLRALGAALAAEGRYAESETILNQALAAARSAEAEAEPGAATARSLSQLARLYLRQDRYEQALPLIEGAMRIDQARLAPDHPVIAADWYDLGVAYLGLSRLADAARAFHTAVDRLDRGPGRDTPSAANVEIGLARVRHRQGREDEARALFDDAGAILHDGERAERRRERRA